MPPDPSPTPSPGLSPRHWRDGPLRSLPGEGVKPRRLQHSPPPPARGRMGGGLRRGSRSMRVGTTPPSRPCRSRGGENAALQARSHLRRGPSWDDAEQKNGGLCAPQFHIQTFVFFCPVVLSLRPVYPVADSGAALPPLPALARLNCSPRWRRRCCISCRCRCGPG